MKNGIQKALQAKQDKTLDILVRYEQGVMTRREWLNMWRIKGATIEEMRLRNYAAEEKLKKWLYDNRDDNSGNPNWPPTKRYNEKREELAAGIYKTFYYLHEPLPSRSCYEITKTEYEYFRNMELAEDKATEANELNYKIEAGTATPEEEAEAMAKEFEFAAKYF